MKKPAATLLLSFALSPGLVLAAGQTTRASVNNAGELGDWDSFNAFISANGRYVAFSSIAGNLAAGDNNGAEDIFVRDRQTGKTTLVSLDSSGGQGNFDSHSPAISADGRFVAFASDADNLVSGDSNRTSDIFVRDRQSNKTTRVSISSSGGQSNGDWGSVIPALSADGRFVAFASDASNLVAGDSNGIDDIFVHDRQTGKTERISIDSAGEQGNSASFNALAISADGRYVAFESWADNLVAGDTNTDRDIFIRDRQTRQTTRVSISSTGGQGLGDSYSPSISADGRFVAFMSHADNLVTGDTNGMMDIFVHDRQIGQTSRVSVDSADKQGNEWSEKPAISADGRYVAFESEASNLVTGDTNKYKDIFVRDREANKTIRVSVNSAGGQSDANSYYPSLSADGRYVAFESYAGNLVAGDSSGWNSAWEDVFVRDSLLQPQNQADVSLALSGPVSVAKGGDARYRFTVSNHGGINAVTTLTAIVSSSGKLKSIISGQGSCTVAAVSVCRLGALAPGQAVTVIATVNVNGKTTVSATAQAAPKDNLPDNNARSIVTQIQ